MASPMDEKTIKREDGSSKVVSARPFRSREGSGGILRLDINKPRLSTGDVFHVSNIYVWYIKTAIIIKYDTKHTFFYSD